MPKTAVDERLRPEVLEPLQSIFEGAIAVDRGIAVVRGIYASIGQRRAVRLRQVSPISSRELLAKGAITESEDKTYWVDMVQPRHGVYLLGTAVWAPVTAGGLEDNIELGYLDIIHTKAIRGDENPQNLLALYDQRENCITAYGMEELTTALLSEDTTILHEGTEQTTHE
jgi:hypothetical protein